MKYLILLLAVALSACTGAPVRVVRRGGIITTVRERAMPPVPEPPPCFIVKDKSNPANVRTLLLCPERDIASMRGLK